MMYCYPNCYPGMSEQTKKQMMAKAKMSLYKKRIAYQHKLFLDKFFEKMVYNYNRNSTIVSKKQKYDKFKKLGTIEEIEQKNKCCCYKAPVNQYIWRDLRFDNIESIISQIETVKCTC